MDITYSVSHSAKFCETPKAPHVAVVKCIMKYLKGSSGLCITYHAQPSNNQLTAYCDADYVVGMDDRKSRSGYVLVLDGGPIAWGSRKQTCTTTSTMEVEYIVAHLASQKIIWMRHLLHDLKYAQIGPTVLCSDNQAAIRLVRNPDFHRSTKHVDIKYRKIREAESLESF
jgi:hypothetical protein